MDTLESINALISANRIMPLDGGLGSELASRGYDTSSSLWSAELILTQPSALVEVHRAYLDAGARCITSASYQASLPGLQALGLDESRARQVFLDSVRLACQARDAFLEDNPACGYRPLVAASVGPYGAYLADGSEYRGNYAASDSELLEFHRPRLQWLDQSGADLIACETMPDLREAGLLGALLESVITPAWFSFCCADEQSLQDGNSISSAARLFKTHANVVAVGVNCLPASLVGGLVRRIRAELPAKWIVVYPNSGEQYDAGQKRWFGEHSTRQWFDQLQDWREAGANLVGGCCRVGPEQIRALVDQLAKDEGEEK